MRNLVGLTFILLVACGAEDPPCDTTAPSDACHALAPGASGPLAVGVTTIELVDLSRGPSDGSGRPLRIDIWYPATADSASLPRATYDLAAEAPADLAATFATIAPPPVEIAAARDASPDRRFAPYPLLTFSHGKNGIRTQTASLMTHLASHGYVVAAPDHTDDTIWDLLRTGGVGLDNVVQMLVERPRDLRFVADQVGALSGPLAELADRNRWAVLGHSFGGATSIIITSSRSEFFDPDVKAAMPITPAVRIVQAIGSGPEYAAVPFWMLGGMNDQTIDYEVDQRWGYDLAPSPKGLSALRRAGHFSFTDLCGLDWSGLGTAFGIDTGPIVDDGCSADFEDPAVVQHASAYFATAFFNRVLRASNDASAAWKPENVPAELQEAVEVASEGW